MPMNGTPLEPYVEGPPPDVPLLLMLACTAEFVAETDVKIHGVEHQPVGAPLLVFRCPRCLAEHRSFRYYPS